MGTKGEMMRYVWLVVLMAACSDPTGPPKISVSLQVHRDGDYCVRTWTASANVEADYQYAVDAPGGGVGAPTWSGNFRTSVRQDDKFWMGPNATGFFYHAHVWGNGLDYNDTRTVSCQ